MWLTRGQKLDEVSDGRVILQAGLHGAALPGTKSGVDQIQ